MLTVIAVLLGLLLLATEFGRALAVFVLQLVGLVLLVLLTVALLDK